MTTQTAPLKAWRITWPEYLPGHSYIAAGKSRGNVRMWSWREGKSYMDTLELRDIHVVRAPEFDNLAAKHTFNKTLGSSAPDREPYGCLARGE